MAIMENIQNSQVVRAYRQGWLAWLGAHKAAFELAQDGVEKLVNSREQMVEDLVQKGEEVEGLAQDNFGKVRNFVEPRFNEVSEKVSAARGKVFSRTDETATDRVEELSAEVAKLAKSVSALSRKVNTAKKPAAKKAAAPKKAAPAKAPAAKAETKPATEAKTAA